MAVTRRSQNCRDDGGETSCVGVCSLVGTLSEGSMSYMTILLQNVTCHAGGNLSQRGSTQAGTRACRLRVVTFPVPESNGPTRRSVAERDRLIVFATAIGTLVPSAMLVSSVLSGPWIRLGATFACSYLLVLAVVLVLRNRFLRLVRTTTWTVRATSRPLPRKTDVHLEALTAMGFTVTNVAVVVDEHGRVYTKPFVLLTRLTGGHVAIATAHGTQILTQLQTGHWLVTATMKVVNHPNVVIQPADNGTGPDLVSLHDQGLLRLAQHGIPAASQPDAMTSSLYLEQLEQELLREITASGRSPRAGMLLERGDVLTDDLIGKRFPRIAALSAMTSRTP